MADTRRKQAALQEFEEVVVAEPARHHPSILRLWKRRANTNAHCLDSIAIEVELGYVFTERFGQAVVAVGTTRRMRVDLLVLPIKPGDVIGTGEDDTLEAMPAGPFIEVVNPLDIGFQHFFEGPFHRYAAEMDDRIATGNQRIDRLLVREIARDDFFMRGRVRRQRERQIRYPDLVRECAHARTNDPPH